jgi:hypothetical protein
MDAEFLQVILALIGLALFIVIFVAQCQLFSIAKSAKELVELVGELDTSEPEEDGRLSTVNQLMASRKS